VVFYKIPKTGDAVGAMMVQKNQYWAWVLKKLNATYLVN
jgi:hypothetical protein